MIALLNLSVLGYSFVVFHDKAKRTQQGDLLQDPLPLPVAKVFLRHFLEPVPGKDRKKKRQTVIKTQREKDDDVEQTSKYATQGFET